VINGKQIIHDMYYEKYVLLPCPLQHLDLCRWF
jgi:hypothetical protein